MSPEVQTTALLDLGQDAVALDGRFIAENLGRVFRHIYRIVRNAADAQRLAQDTFLNVLQRAEHLRSDQKAAHLLSRIATDTALAFLRRDADVSSNEVEGNRLDAGGDPDRISMWGGERGHFETGLRLLNPQERAALILRDVEGLPGPEVARRLGCSRAAARSHIANARNKIRRHIFHETPGAMGVMQ